MKLLTSAKVFIIPFERVVKIKNRQRGSCYF